MASSGSTKSAEDDNSKDIITQHVDEPTMGPPVKKTFSAPSFSYEENAPDEELAHEDVEPSKVPSNLIGGKRVLLEKDCLHILPYCWSPYRKWLTIIVIALVQMSMNFNSGTYASSLAQFKEEWPDKSDQALRVGQAVMLICYAFGCELWAPWSEEFGRWPIMQLSLFLVNIWQILCALAPNFGSLIVGRILLGLSSAGGSVTLGMVADLWDSYDQGLGVATVVLSSVGGSTIGPFFGGMIGQWTPSWHWNFWIQLIVGGFTQLVHFLLVRETRSTTLLDREARRRRKTGEDTDIWGPDEIKEHRLELREILRIWRRPFEMFVREPIVLFLSLLSGFSDALIFVFTSSFSLVFSQTTTENTTDPKAWDFNTLAVGMAFGSILIGYVIAYLIVIPDVLRQRYIHKRDGKAARTAERRLLLLLFLGPLEPIGLLGFAWTTQGSDESGVYFCRNCPWIAPLIFAALIAIANFDIYAATIDYMVAAYGPYSASATGGNGFARDLLAGIATMYSTPMYSNIGNRFHLQWASTLLGCIGVIAMIPVYLFYFYGPRVRERSKFAQLLEADREKKEHEMEEAKQNPKV